MVEYIICNQDEDEPIIVTKEDCESCMLPKDCDDCDTWDCKACEFRHKLSPCDSRHIVQLNGAVKRKYIKERTAKPSEYKKVRHLINNPKIRRKNAINTNRRKSSCKRRYV